MAADPIIPRKWRLRAHHQQNVFVWGARERSVHTLMKAFLWALYLPQYPHITVEVKIGDRYKPDLIAYAGETIAPAGILTVKEDPLFWGEAGQVGREKIESIVRRYKNTHFALAKWNTSLHTHRQMIESALKDVRRSAPFDLLSFPADSRERFINDEGNITLTHEDLEWMRL
jgi:hypothetical protein